MDKNGIVEVRLIFKPGDKGYDELLNTPRYYRSWEVRKVFLRSLGRDAERLAKRDASEAKRTPVDLPDF